MTQAKRNSELIKMVSLCKDDWRVSTLDLSPVLTLDQDTRTDLGHSPSPEVPLNSGPPETSHYGHEAGEAARSASEAAARVTGRGEAGLQEAAGAGLTLGGHKDGEAARPAHTAASAGGARGRGHARGCNNLRVIRGH